MSRVESPNVPPSLNRVLRMHWANKSRMRAIWEMEFLTMPFAERQRLKDARSEQKRVKMLITLHNARQYDRDNAFGAVKVIVDAAKAAGLIYDDRPAYLDLEVQQQKCKRASKRTVIEMEICE